MKTTWRLTEALLMSALCSWLAANMSMIKGALSSFVVLWPYLVGILGGGVWLLVRSLFARINSQEIALSRLARQQKEAIEGVSRVVSDCILPLPQLNITSAFIEQIRGEFRKVVETTTTYGSP
jgi:hypothetical protein